MPYEDKKYKLFIQSLFMAKNKYLAIVGILIALSLFFIIFWEQPVEEAISLPEQIILPDNIPVKQPPLILIPDSRNYRIQVFNDTNNTYQFVSMFGSFGNEEGKLKQPVDIDQEDGKIFVLDREREEIIVFNETYDFLYSFGKPYLDIAFGFDIFNGKIYVANSYSSKIDVFTLDGKPLYSFGQHGDKEGEFKIPYDIMVDKDFLYVADAGNARIQKLTHNGTFVKAWGRYSRDDEGFKQPASIGKLDAILFVADMANSRIKMYDEDGTLIKIIGSYGRGEEQYKQPSKIWVIDQRVYVADTANHRIKVLDSQGNLITIFGGYGRGTGQFRTPGIMMPRLGISSLSLSSSV